MLPLPYSHSAILEKGAAQNPGQSSHSLWTFVFFTVTYFSLWNKVYELEPVFIVLGKR